MCVWSNHLTNVDQPMLCYITHMDSRRLTNSVFVLTVLKWANANWWLKTRHHYPTQGAMNIASFPHFTCAFVLTMSSKQYNIKMLLSRWKFWIHCLTLSNTAILSFTAWHRFFAFVLILFLLFSGHDYGQINKRIKQWNKLSAFSSFNVQIPVCVFNPDANMDGLFYCRPSRPTVGVLPNSQPDGRLASSARKTVYWCSTGQSQCPVLLHHLGVQWRWPRGVIHLTSSLHVAAPPVAGPGLLISTVI